MSPSGYRIYYDRLAARGYSVLWFLIFVFTTFTVIPLSVNKLSSNLHWLSSIRDSQPDFYDQLIINQRSLTDVNFVGCQLLWQSQVVASDDPDSASSILKRMSNCHRAELITRWKGNLAWLLSNQSLAREEWSKLSPNNSLEWGRVLFHAGDRDRSILLIDLALRDETGALHDAQRATAYRTMGEIFWSSGDVEKSVYYFERAWLTSPLDYYLSFQLGRAYALAYNCGRAIEVMKAGRTVQDSIFRPQLDISYALQLGECYMLEGDIQAGMAEVELSKELLTNASQDSNTTALIPLRQRQEKLAAQLQKLLSP